MDRMLPILSLGFEFIEEGVIWGKKRMQILIGFIFFELKAEIIF